VCNIIADVLYYIYHIYKIRNFAKWLPGEEVLFI